MTHVVLIHAGPTPWDVEDRLVGDHPLPLTEEAPAAIEGSISGLTVPIAAVYRSKKNEAADQTARLIAARYNLRPHDSAALDEVNLGLWQGLTRNDLHFRFPSVFPQWEENPMAVNPPDGEPLPEAIGRIRDGLKRIIKRNRGSAIALALRPLALQIASGLLKREDEQQIAGHLHNSATIETIGISDEHLHLIVA